MELELAVLPGDGVGPEATAEALNVLEAVGQKFDQRLNFSEGLVGGRCCRYREQSSGL